MGIGRIKSIDQLSRSGINMRNIAWAPLWIGSNEIGLSSKNPWILEMDHRGYGTVNRLDPPTPRRRRVRRDLRLAIPALATTMDTRATASEQQNNSSEQTQDGSDEGSPGRGAPGGDDGGAGVVDGGADDGEGDEVGDDDDEDDDEGDEGAERGEEAADEPGAEREREGDEGEARGHRVQDHDLRQGARRVVRVGRERDVVHAVLDHGYRVVAYA